MSDDPPERPDLAAIAKNLKAAEELFLECVDAMRDYRDDPATTLSLTRAERDARPRNTTQAAILLIQERNRYVKALQDAENSAPDAPIDFDAVRCEIGSRLDRIRVARDAEGLSGGLVE